MDRFWFCVCVFACTNVVFSWEVAPEIKAVQEGDRAKAPPGKLTSVVFSWRVAPEIKAVQEGDLAKAPPGRLLSPHKWQIETSFGSKTRHLKWEVKVEYMFGTPDCMEHGLKGSNGQFLGPTIRNKAGDTISVEVTNKLHTEGVVIHWHGITQLGTPIPWADGTPSVSQYAINPGETFLYRFKVNRAGTYVYHGHFGMQRSARLYGSLIVDVGDGEKGPFHYDGVHDQEVDLSSKPFRWTRGPRKLLIKDDKEIRRNMASVHGSISNPSGSESFSPDDQLP